MAFMLSLLKNTEEKRDGTTGDFIAVEFRRKDVTLRNQEAQMEILPPQSRCHYKRGARKQWER